MNDAIDSRKELIEKLTMLFSNYGIDTRDAYNDIVILTNDYEIMTRETALAICDEDKNQYFLGKFLIAKTVRGCTDRTLGYYKDTISKILFAINKSADEITPDDIRYYLAIRERRDGISKVTCGNEWRSLSAFFTWLHNEDLIKTNPMKRVERPKVPKVQKEAFTEMEIEKMRGALQNSKCTAIFEMLLSTGCRVTELVTIKIVDLKGDSVVVHGKGNKDRVVYFNARCQIAIEKYLNDRQDDNPYLFPKQFTPKESRGYVKDAYKYKKFVHSDGHMTASSVEDVIRTLGRIVDVKAHPHKFRRTCATFALRRGMPIEQVSKMLGHDNVSTTQIYLDLDETELKASHRKYVV